MNIIEKNSPGAPAPGGFIPLIEPEIAGNEWAYVKECLDTGWVSSVGAYVDRFESLVAKAAGTRHAVATVNGTAALHISLLVAGVEPGDEVLVPSLTFIAPVNAVRYAGAWPVFIDSEPRYWQMDPAEVVRFLDTECEWTGGRLLNRATRRRVSAILVVHILGHPMDLGEVLEAAKKYKLPVIEDATEGLGAHYKESPLGRLGDIGCFSFNGNKIITTGGGGMIVTSRAEWADRAKYLTTQAKDDPIEYVHKQIGYNYRLTNVLAAVGCAQMEQLESNIARKREIAARYEEVLSDVSGITVMPEAAWAHSTFWMYTILVDQAECGCSSRGLMRRLAERKIQSRPLWQPVHLSPAHRDAERRICPVAERLAANALSLPCSAGMSALQQERVIEELGAVLRECFSPANAAVLQ